jgi:hypothetical protein
MQPSRASLLKVIVLAVTACVQASSAAAVISAPDLVATPGSAGAFDILLTVTNNLRFQAGAFSFDILSSSPLLRFTNAMTATTVPYIFAGNSFDDINGFPLATDTGQELIASDAPNSGFESVSNDATVSLGRVFYTISASAALGSTIDINFGAATSIADPMANRLAITPVNGAISIAAVPEPVHMPIILACLGLIALAYWRRRSAHRDSAG